jgi:hypothetical protein
MDAQITARPPVTEDPAPRARLPGEPAEPSAEEGLGEWLGAVALPQGESLSESSLAPPAGGPALDPRIVGLGQALELSVARTRGMGRRARDSGPGSSAGQRVVSAGTFC